MPVTLGLVGRKGRELLRSPWLSEIEFEQTGIFQKLSFANAQTIATLAIDAFTSGRADKVLLVYNEFRSVISQKVVVDQLLPIARTDGGAVDTSNTSDYLYEPSAQRIFDELLPRYVEVQVYRRCSIRTRRSTRRR